MIARCPQSSLATKESIGDGRRHLLLRDHRSRFVPAYVLRCHTVFFAAFDLSFTGAGVSASVAAFKRHSGLLALLWPRIRSQTIY